jgi:hypothetical protein
MSATVLLNDIVGALEMQSDDSLSFVDLDTGQVETVSRDLLSAAEEAEDEEEESDVPEWQQPEWELAKRIIFSGRFVKLPDKFHVHEWSIMQDFANSVSSERISEDLLNAIHGSGAFRYFKDTLRRHRIEKDWYAFRSEALAEIARDWCEENQVAWR